MTIVRLDNGYYDIGDGVRVPSVTTVLQVLQPRYGHGGRAEFYMERGSEAHDVIVNLLQGKHIKSIDPVIAPFVAAWIRFREEMGFVLCDWIEGGSVFDWKTAANLAVTPNMKPQVAAYVQAIGETNPRSTFIELPVASRKYGFSGTVDAVGQMTRAKSQRRGRAHLVLLGPEGDYRVVEVKEQSKHFNVFLSCLNIYNYLDKKETQ